MSLPAYNLFLEKDLFATASSSFLTISTQGTEHIPVCGHQHEKNVNKKDSSFESFDDIDSPLKCFTPTVS